MRRATVTIPDELDAALTSFVAAQPARPSLASVVEAALEAYLRAPTEPPSRLPAVMRAREAVRAAARSRGVERIAVFGSVASGSDGSESDIDFWVEGAHLGLFDLAALRHDLTELLGAPVDVVTLGGLAEAEREQVMARSLAL